jgi:hypothetical protein
MTLHEGYATPIQGKYKYKSPPAVANDRHVLGKRPSLALLAILLAPRHRRLLHIAVRRKETIPGTFPLFVVIIRGFVALSKLPH